MPRHPADGRRNVHLAVAVHVADAVAAAQVQHRQRHMEPGPAFPDKFQHNVGCALVDVLTEDLTAHVAVEALQLDGRQGQSIGHHLLGLAGLNGRAEFAVHLAGGHGLVGVGVDARRQPQQDFLRFALFSGDPGDGVQLLPVVHHKVADAPVHGEGDVPVGLVVGVEPGIFQRKARLHRRVDLAGGHHIDAHALLLGDFIDPFEAVGLAGIEGRGPGAEALLKGPAVHAHILPDTHLVQEIEGRAVFGGQGYGVMAPKKKMAVFAHGQIAAEHSDPTCVKILVHHSTKAPK